MHQRIMHDDASTHQAVISASHNSGMHEKTRENIRKLIAGEPGLSERRLAMDCGMNQSTLNRFMKGESDTLEFNNLQQLAHYFSLTVSQLIGEVPFEEDRKVRSVVLAMQQMPEYKKDMLVAATLSLAQPDDPKQANGHQ
jgi:transcriptional regulator with XRE-family HTH domain